MAVQPKKAKTTFWAGQWRCRDQKLVLSEPVIMGVMNITPDSFSDGGNFLEHQEILLNEVLASGQYMVQEGARILDIGGESSRPGAEPVGDD